MGFHVEVEQRRSRERVHSGSREDCLGEEAYTVGMGVCREREDGLWRWGVWEEREYTVGMGVHGKDGSFSLSS